LRVQLIEGYPALQPDNKFIRKFVSGFDSANVGQFLDLATNPMVQQTAFNVLDRVLPQQRPRQNAFQTYQNFRRAGYIRGAENETPQDRRKRLLKERAAKRKKRGKRRRRVTQKQSTMSPNAPQTQQQPFDTRLLIPNAMDIAPNAQLQLPAPDMNQDYDDTDLDQENSDEGTTDGFFFPAFFRHAASRGGGGGLTRQISTKSAGNLAMKSIDPLNLRKNAVSNLRQGVDIAHSVLPGQQPTAAPPGQQQQPQQQAAQQQAQQPASDSQQQSQPSSSAASDVSSQVSGDGSDLDYYHHITGLDEFSGAGFDASYRMYIYYKLKPGANPKATISKPRGNWSAYLHNPAQKRMSVLVRSEPMKANFINAFVRANPSWVIAKTSQDTPATTPGRQATPDGKRIVQRPGRTASQMPGKTPGQSQSRRKPGQMPGIKPSPKDFIPGIKPDSHIPAEMEVMTKEIARDTIPANAEHSNVFDLKKIANGILPAAIVAWLAMQL
jgi:hypothetical protein